MVPVIGGLSPSVLGHDGKFISLVHPVRAYGKLDITGAKEAGRIKSLRYRGARQLERQAPPADLKSYQERLLQRAHHLTVEQPANVLELPGERGRSAEERRRFEVVETQNAEATPEQSAPEPDLQKEYFDMLFEARAKKANR